MRYATPGQNISFFAEAVSNTSYLEYTSTVANLTAFGSDNGAASGSLSGVTAVWDSNMGMFRITIPSANCPVAGHMFYGVIGWTGIIDVKFEFYMSATLATATDVTNATSPLATSIALSTAQTAITAIKAKTDNLPASIPTASDNATALLAATTRTGRTVGKSLRILEIMVNGNVTGLTSGDGSPVRFTLGSSYIEFTVNANKNRTLSTVHLV